jgi:hypothetical protein
VFALYLASPNAMPAMMAIWMTAMAWSRLQNGCFLVLCRNSARPA